MNAAVVGGSGQIGGWLLRILRERGHTATGTHASVPYPGLSFVDASDHEKSAEWLRAQRPNVVFYPAGFTYVDGCQSDPGRARAANVDDPMALARISTELGARFVYFSTDYVFDGSNGPNTESDLTNPLSSYGQVKREAEIALAGFLGDRLLTVRTSWVFGPERQGKNFAYQLARTLRAGRTLICPSDQRSSPSYGPDVARAVVLLAEEGHSGLIHVAGPETMSRLQFARSLAEGLGLDANLIMGKPTHDMDSKTPRPLNGGLATPQLDARRPGLIRPLSQAIADFQTRTTGSEGWANPLGPL